MISTKVNDVGVGGRLGNTPGLSWHHSGEQSMEEGIPPPPRMSRRTREFTHCLSAGLYYEMYLDTSHDDQRQSKIAVFIFKY